MPGAERIDSSRTTRASRRASRGRADPSAV